MLVNRNLISNFKGLNVLEMEHADTTIVSQAYMSELYGLGDGAMRKAIEFLEVGSLKNQICLRSTKAINRLSWIGVDDV